MLKKRFISILRIISKIRLVIENGEKKNANGLGSKQKGCTFALPKQPHNVVNKGKEFIKKLRRKGLR